MVCCVARGISNSWLLGVWIVEMSLGGIRSVFTSDGKCRNLLVNVDFSLCSCSTHVILFVCFSESETQRGHLLGEVNAHPFAVSGFV